MYNLKAMNELRMYKYQPSFYFIRKQTFPIDDIFNRTKKNPKRKQFFCILILSKKKGKQTEKENKRFTI